MGGGVGADARQREQPLLHVGDRQVRVAQRVQVERALRDRRRQRAEVRPAVPRLRHLAVERIGGGGHRRRGREGARRQVGIIRGVLGRLAEVGDQRADHPFCGRPGAVRRADRLDDVLEEGCAAHHPARSGRRPGEVRVVGQRGVEAGEVGVEPQQVGHRRQDGGGVAVGARAGEGHVGPVGFLARDPDHPHRAVAVAHGGGEGAPLLVDPVRREGGDAVRENRAPEVDRLAARAAERDGTDRGERGGHGVASFGGRGRGPGRRSCPAA